MASVLAPTLRLFFAQLAGFMPDTFGMVKVDPPYSGAHSWESIVKEADGQEALLSMKWPWKNARPWQDPGYLHSKKTMCRTKWVENSGQGDGTASLEELKSLAVKLHMTKAEGMEKYLSWLQSMRLHSNEVLQLKAEIVDLQQQKGAEAMLATKTTTLKNLLAMDPGGQKQSVQDFHQWQAANNRLKAVMRLIQSVEMSGEAAIALSQPATNSSGVQLR